MAGTLYGIGVGPGDSELLTVKAVRLLKECDLIAVPDSGAGEYIALEIVRPYVEEQEVLRCPLPMVRDQALLEQHRQTAADLLCKHLQAGRNIAFLTLGDPTVYSTYWYLHQLVLARGHRAEMVAGVPSFCAAAAALGIGLCETEEALHILPASYPGTDRALALDGNKVFMKSGAQLENLVLLLREAGLLEQSALAERVGMEGERLVSGLAQFQGSAGYLSLVIVKEKREQ